MTYTFKLSRRLAVSRRISMLSAILLFAACSGDATAPDGSLWTGSPEEPRFRRTVPVTVSISPSAITVETNQLIQFAARGTTLAGDTVAAAVDWSASGGTILADGRFSASATGSFMVLARSQERQTERIDTAVVNVVRRQPLLVSLAISPGSTTLSPGISQTFLVTGYLKDGRAVPVGAHWSATGGSIDAGGNYIAGDTAGTYQVIATSTFRTVSDTATVTIGAPPPPPPPPPGLPPTTPPTPAPPAPVLAKLVLRPGTATLAPTTTRQFVALGVTTDGDTIPVAATFVPTGGTVGDSGLYRAGSIAGSYTLIAKSGTVADTSTILVTAPSGSGPAGFGVPMGLQGLIASGVNSSGSYTFSSDAYNPETILIRLADARRRNVKVLMNMTGGSHSNYMTNGVFDMAKWRAKMDLYNTPAIKAAVAEGVADGTILGNSVMDEPNNSSTGAEGGDANTWGPPGTMTKPKLDNMARYVKAIFPTLPVGFLGRYDWRTTETFTDIDFAIRQYSHRLPDGDAGNITRFIEEALAQGTRDGIVTAFSLNLLNGGIKAPNFNYAEWVANGTTWNCSLATTGGQGLKPGNCRVHSSQIDKWGRLLGGAGVGLMMWRYDSAFFAHAGNQAALSSLAAHMSTLPRRPWRR
jgi:hypothetical protein